MHSIHYTHSVYYTPPSHRHTLLIFVILIFIASAVHNILPFFAMIGAGTHITLTIYLCGSLGADIYIQKNITISQLHTATDVYSHPWNIFSFRILFPEYL